jgi:hypothetical protein
MQPVPSKKQYSRKKQYSKRKNRPALVLEPCGFLSRLSASFGE